MPNLSDLIINGKFLWGGRWHLTAPGMDCLGLAIEVRRRINQNTEPLPEFKEIYQKYKRHQLPASLVLDLVSSHPRTKPTNKPRLSDLAVIDGNRGMILGT
jgi:hypothetical protein